MASSALEARILGLFLFLGDVHVHIRPRREVYADDHSLINFRSRTDEHFAAPWMFHKGESGGGTGTIRDESAGGPRSRLADVIRPAGEDGMDQGGVLALHP